MRLGILVGVKDINIEKVGGTAQTGRDWSSDFAYLSRLPTDPALGANQIIRKAKDVTWIMKYGSANASTAVIYTVPTGKTFYLAYFFCTQGDSYPRDLVIRDELDATKGYLVMGAMEGQVSPVIPPLRIPEGWDIALIQGAAVWTRAGIFGWEE